MPADQGWLAAWASPSGDVSSWYTATFGVDGAPSAAPRRLMDAPPGLTTLRLRALDAQRGLVVGAFESEDSDPEAPTYGLSTLVVSSTGTLLSGHATLIEECDAIVWIDVVPLTNGALVAWAEDLGDHAEVYASVVNLDGHRETDVFALHNQARAWQLVRHAKGAMLGVVTSDGNVEFVAIDAGGQPIQRQTILADHTAESDIDLAAVGDRVLVAFSDHRELEPRIYSAWIALDGAMQSDLRPISTPYGASTLVGLRGTPNGALLLWQNTTHEPDVVRVGKVDGEGRLGGESLALPLPPRARAGEPHDLLVPQLETTDGSIVVMQPPCTGSRECRKHADVLELGSDLKVQSRVSWSHRANADLVWDFQCGAVHCAALAANFGNRTRIQLLTTAAGTRTPAVSHKPDPGGNLAPLFSGSVRAILATPELAALEAVRVGQNEILTTLTAFDPNTPYQVPTTPAPDGRLAPVQAELTTYVVPDASQPATRGGTVANAPLSIRARSVAGVEVTSAGNEALVVWTAIDEQKPQVFLTTIDDQGRKVRQSMLTRQSGEVLALAAATAKDRSYYVAWARDDGKSNKLYAAHVNSNLTRLSPDTLIAETSGSISNVDVVVTAGGVYVVMAQSTDGAETLRWLRLNAATLQPYKGPNPSPIAAVEKVSQFAPRLSHWNDGLALAWLSRSAGGATVNIARLDAKGDVVRNFEAAVPGEPSTLNVSCESDCNVAITGELADEARGYVALLRVPAAAPAVFEPTPIVVSRRLSPAGSQVRPAASSGGGYYFDVEPGAERGAVHEVRAPSTP